MIRIHPKEQLTEHFSLGEMCRSATAKKYGLPNLPREECELANLRALCRNVLEPARQILSSPLRITSGFRSTTLNRLVGGSKSSQHMLGEAADFCPYKLPVRDAAFTLSHQEHLPFDQLIYERRKTKGGWQEWIHISHCRVGLNRHQALSIAVDGNTRMVEEGIKAPPEFILEPAE
ncbi:D-Ala-D-Ala carboxypeptidase family metallohydrolase [Kordiimonas laminariae]|uniref:D-Ala-D-Ala carboxypeptidase family metallohydrolase n=1 Tax=Kordiimonas laminariae TaxID=2917717 RepID=UPI001FF2BE43|nr:D-Ala-D-Ala carboxypeptidase family metallohydrolase [Kordiimonas laminariae]MCK0068025.1 D-Ala-D-Ala carboxypeptidase family metallohydrolase [Kordiimonas laminariae]